MADNIQHPSTSLPIHDEGDQTCSSYATSNHVGHGSVASTYYEQNASADHQVDSKDINTPHTPLYTDFNTVKKNIHIDSSYTPLTFSTIKHHSQKISSSNHKHLTYNSLQSPTHLMDDCETCDIGITLPPRFDDKSTGQQYGMTPMQRFETSPVDPILGTALEGHTNPSRSDFDHSFPTSESSLQPKYHLYPQQISPIHFEDTAIGHPECYIDSVYPMEESSLGMPVAWHSGDLVGIGGRFMDAVRDEREGYEGCKR